MPIITVLGDLFDNEFGAEAIAHGCNCQGIMGAGIALEFKKRYPEMHQEYFRRCRFAKPREFNVGDAFLWKEDGKPFVFNLGTQENCWNQKATYEGIEAALTEMRRLADEEGIASIALPRIGAGLGGLSWNKVQAVIKRVFKNWAGTLYVYGEGVL